MKSFLSKYIKLVLLSLSITTIACAQNSQISEPQTYTAYKTTEKIVVDGKAEDKDWGKVNWTNPFIDIEGVKQPKYKTQVKMLWDDTYFYIFAKMEEPHVWANLTKRDTIIFRNNDFEVFVEPNGDTHHYYELEINALNTVWDLFVSKPYRNGNVVLNDWNITGLKSAVQIDGTINNSKDIDKGWSLEIAIPWSVYKTGYFQKIKPAGNFWKVNFSRVNWDYQLTDGVYERKKDEKGKLHHEYNWVWSSMDVINMHEPEKWGYVYFSSEAPKKDNLFSIPEDEKVKGELYKIHRVLNAHYKKQGDFLTSLDTVVTDKIQVAGKVIQPKLESHSTGYNLFVVSPFTNKTLIVKEDGKFLSK